MKYNINRISIHTTSSLIKETNRDKLLDHIWFDFYVRFSIYTYNLILYDEI
jgi:hypothetical protein